MFNIGWTELLLIAIVFLIFIKPQDFPFFIKKIVKFFYKIKNSLSDITENFKVSKCINSTYNLLISTYDSIIYPIYHF